MANISITSNPQEVTPDDEQVYGLKFDFDKPDIGEKFVTLKVQSGTFNFNTKGQVMNESPDFVTDDEFKFSTKSSSVFCWIKKTGSSVLEVSFI